MAAYPEYKKGYQALLNAIRARRERDGQIMKRASKNGTAHERQAKANQACNGQ